MFARNFSQKLYLELLASDASVVVGSGSAGTGKTLLACHAGSKALASGRVERLILTRPAVSVDEQHGFLPGNLEKKMEPWTRPMFDALYHHISPKKVSQLIQERKIEVCPLAYMRGRTFDYSWIIGDEMQNSTPSQMKMLLTRLGTNSKMVITGDPDQHDRGFENNGLTDLISRIDPESNDIFNVKFSDEDVVRSEVIKEILRMYL
jgi:phosphate starvation-inducible PhoH-like protein